MEKKIFENGIHAISNDDYHSSAGISRSALMKFKRSPYHYWFEYESGLYQKPEPTPALILGDVVHTLVLEPDLYAERYVISPKFDRRTTQGKADHQAFIATSMGRTVLTEDIAAQAVAMSGAVLGNEIAKDLLMDCEVEKSIYFTHESTGLQFKARPDAMHGSVVIDLKTSLNASFRQFQSSAFSYGYFLQSGLIHQALKSIGVDMEKFVFVVVEKDAPFATGIYVLDDEALDYGVNQFNELAEAFARCKEKGDWPAYGVQTLTLPGYAKYETFMEIEE